MIPLEFLVIFLIGFGIWRASLVVIKTLQSRQENKRLEMLNSMISLLEFDDPKLALQLKQKLGNRLLPAGRD